MNIANYREHWNEMAHVGRGFGSPLTFGYVLPLSGRVVTKEDMALLTAERAFEEDLRRRVTETNVTQGIRVRTPSGRELVRPGAYVGDEGLPRFPNKKSDLFVPQVVAAYGDPVQQFDQSSDLGLSSQHPVVRFWNKNTPLLVQHILDARRTDRDMRLAPGMRQAEIDLANLWIVNPNGPPTVQSLDELVTLLVGTHPPTPGLNPRDVVISGLNAELMQYRDHARRMAQERAERDQARQSRPDIAFTAENEFTRPAAQLELPSAMYDYGALSPAEHLTISSRANHERIVAYAAAIQRAVSELQARFNEFQNGTLTAQQAAEKYGGSIKEMRDTLEILRRIQTDFKNAYALGSFSQIPTGAINDTLGLLTSAILGLPTVGLRNMTQGQFEVFAMSRAMGTAGHWMSLWNTMKAIPKTLIRFGLHAGEAVVRKSNLGLAVLTGKNRHIFEDAVKNIGNLLAGTDFTAAGDRVMQLGMDNRVSFLERLKRIWDETTEFVNAEDQENAWSVGGRRVGMTATVPFKVARAFFDKIGVQQYDFAINTTALNYADLLIRRLKSAAMNYGEARKGLGQFDPTNPAWQLKANEWGPFMTKAENEDSLGAFRLFLEGGPSAEGFQLERSMWNYYQAVQAGNPNPPMMTESQFDSMTRKLLAEFNSSTPANRPSASAASPILRNLLLLQGYPSDLLLKIINTSMGGARDRGSLANALVKTPTIAMLAFMAILIGYMVSAITGSWEKYVRGRAPSLATPLDRDFWTNWKRWADGTLALGAAQFAYIGDLILAMKGEVIGNRGFDPTGRILTVSLMTRFINALRGTWNTVRGAGSAKDAAVPMVDVARSMVPFWLETENILGRSQGPLKQAERVRRGEAQVQGLLEGRSGFQMPTYGPTTVVRRNLGDAVGRWFLADKAGDTSASASHLTRAREEAGKLEEYHYQKYVAAGKDPATARQMAQRDVWNDYQDINPAVSSLMGRRPTQAQNDLMLQGITGERRRVVDAGENAWKAGAMALFGRQGSTTREEVAAARGVGGGRGFNLPGVRLPRMPSMIGRTRPALGPAFIPSAVRSIRTRISRMTQAPGRAIAMRPSTARRRPRLVTATTRRRAPTVGRVRRQRLPRVASTSRRRAYSV